MKKTIKVLIIMFFAIIVLGTTVNAGTVSIKAGKSAVTVGQNVSVTVSFGGKVSAAQFKLNYDKSKFDYVSCSAGTFGTGTNTYVYVNYEDVEDLGSVTLTFKSKSTGTADFKISGVVLSSNSSISNGSTKVTVKEATTKPTTTTTTKKPTKKPSSSSASNKKDETEKPEEPEQIDKTALNNIKTVLEGKVQSDYTEESWKALQDAIAAAEGATKSSDYDAVKDKLNVDNLVKLEVKKDELDKVLRDLIGKSKEDYTEESWTELQTAIETADSAELQSDYDAVKDKLTINGLILDEKDFLEQVMDNSCGHRIYLIILASLVVIFLIIIIILCVAYTKAKNSALMGRRMK